MALSSWIAFGDSIKGETRLSIISLMHRSRIRTHGLGEAVEGGLGVAVFAELDETLYALLRNHSTTTMVLALHVGSDRLTSPVLWQLINAGAWDVLHWPCLPEAADDVACRLERWSAVDALLDSP